jgi:hypothetical protein
LPALTIRERSLTLLTRLEHFYGRHGRLPHEWEIMIAVNHRLALSNPALSSALSKKSFSSVSSPIFACSALIKGLEKFM